MLNNFFFYSDENCVFFIRMLMAFKFYLQYKLNIQILIMRIFILFIYYFSHCLSY